MIKVGAVVATRGRAALLGNSFVKAIQLAKEELTNTTYLGLTQEPSERWDS